jgi:tRNA(Ile)-lysidine synthase
MLQDIVRQTLINTQVSLENETLIVAVSGGVDSLVMLDCLVRLQGELGYRLHVATFDHGLRGEQSAADAADVKSLAEKLGLPVSLGRADVSHLAARSSSNLEAIARQARYTFLAQTALEQDAYYIAVGHHRDDQIETVLMHLLRGSGLTGLRGMAAAGRLSAGHLLEDADPDLFDFIDSLTLLRPLLDASRHAIGEYAAAQGLVPREDPSNADTHFLRNRLRHEVLPLLESINPNFQATLLRSIEVVQGDYEVVENAIAEITAELVDWGETVGGDDHAGGIAYVERDEFMGLSVGLQRGLLRSIITDLLPNQADLPFERIEEARALIENGETGQQLHLPAGIILTIGYDDFTVHVGGELPFPPRIPHLESHKVIPLDPEGETIVGGNQRFYTYWVIEGRSQEIVRDDPLEATLAVPPEAELMLRTRREGDRFCPLGMGGKSQKLSDAFTNLKVPRSLRDRVPLLVVDGEIAWFVAPTAYGLQGRVAEPFAVKPDSEHILRVRWEMLR